MDHNIATPFAFTELRGTERVLRVGLVRRLLRGDARPLGLEDDHAAGGHAQHAHRRPVRGGWGGVCMPGLPNYIPDIKGNMYIGAMCK